MAMSRFGTGSSSSNDDYGSQIFKPVTFDYGTPAPYNKAVVRTDSGHKHKIPASEFTFWLAIIGMVTSEDKGMDRTAYLAFFNTLGQKISERAAVAKAEFYDVNASMWLGRHSLIPPNVGQVITP